MPAKPNGWTSDAKLVLFRLDRIDGDLSEINQRLQRIESRVWMLQVKAAGVGGFVAFLTSYFMGKL